MDDTLRNLLELLKSYSPGDLIGGIEIQEIAEALSGNTDVTDEVRETCVRINAFFTELLRNGFSDKTETAIHELVTALEGMIQGESSVSELPEKESQAVTEDSDFEVLLSFLQEAQDHLENIEEKILQLEKGNDPVVVNDIFRSIHTIKGVSSFIGLHKVKALSHSLESVLDKLREDELEISAELIDLLLAGTDLLNRMVSELHQKADGKLKTGNAIDSPDSHLDISGITAALDLLLIEAPGQENGESGAEALISGEMIENFTEESFRLLDEADENLRSLESEPYNSELVTNAFRSLHTIKGNAGFLGFGLIEQVCLNIESILDRIRKGEQSFNKQIGIVVLESIEAIRFTLEKIRNGEEIEENAEALVSAGEDDEEGSGDAVPAGYKPFGEALIEAGGTTREAVERALDLQQRKLGEILIDGGKVKQDQVDAALHIQQMKQSQSPQEQVRTQRQDIRVDTEKLDKLFDLMGELITSEAMVIDHPDLQKYDFEKFYIAAGYLSKITREMQEITMAIRMIPLEGLFNKMRRLVRDLSRKFNKQINLEISGQETEMDRNVMEEISDPIVHIIRNAMDHGIEDKKSRKEAGKDEAGTIKLNARYEGNEIWISIKDDGKGLSRDKILQKAAENGLLKNNSIESMSDKDVWALIFEPGFSTAESISEVSGRGVGMDVVKKNIDKLRGKVDIQSVEGRGTEIILRIPLTLAIIDGISIKVADKLYSMPINDIISFHKVEEGQVTVTKKGNEVLNLRKEILPVIKLFEVYRIQTEKTKISDGIVIVVTADGIRAALLVDEIVGYKQIVIKALPEYMGDMEGISGCSILGNGEVSLIIDTNALLHRVID